MSTRQTSVKDLYNCIKIEGNGQSKKASYLELKEWERTEKRAMAVLYTKCVLNFRRERIF